MTDIVMASVAFLLALRIASANSADKSPRVEFQRSPENMLKLALRMVVHSENYIPGFCGEKLKRATIKPDGWPRNPPVGKYPELPPNRAQPGSSSSILHAYSIYYNVEWTHLDLNNGSPNRRSVQRRGRIIAADVLGGLHDPYGRI